MNRLVSSIALRAVPSTLTVGRARILLPQTFTARTVFPTPTPSLIFVRSISYTSTSNPKPKKEDLAKDEMKGASEKSILTGMKEGFEEGSLETKDWNPEASHNVHVDYSEQPKPSGGYGYSYNEYKAGKEDLTEKAKEKAYEASKSAQKVAQSLTDQAGDMKKAAKGVKDEAMYKAGEMKDKAMEKAGEMKDTVVDTANSMASSTTAEKMKDKVIDKAAEMKDKIVTTVGEAHIPEKVKGVASSVAETVSEKAKKLKDVAVENAMTTGGSVLGAAAKKMENVGKKLQEGGEKMQQTAQSEAQEKEKMKNTKEDK